MMRAADQRYHQSIAWQMAGRHPHMLPPPHLSRAGILPPSSMVGLSPYPQAPGWPSPLDPYGRDPYRLMDPMLRTYPMNPMLDAMRVEEAKAYAAASAAHYRNKDPSPVPQMGHPPTVPSPHHRLPGQLKPPMGPGPPSSQPSGSMSLPIATNDLHKKEDASR